MEFGLSLVLKRGPAKKMRRADLPFSSSSFRPFAISRLVASKDQNGLYWQDAGRA
ncbi:hypothetical protein [Variovorax sp. AFSI2.2]|uniref:hypothetical protein n=1 Tax=Variovorax sp. AFSI2.2 TaxID=3384160 RepID=UPI003EB8D403